LGCGFIGGNPLNFSGGGGGGGRGMVKFLINFK